MKFLGLVIRNLFHSRRRTIFTILSITIALFLFTTLQTVITAFNSAVEFADAARLIVRRSTSLVFPLPLAYRERIAAVDGVTGITWANWFGGVYQDPKQFFAKFAVDSKTYFDIYPEIEVPADQMKAYQSERTATIVGEGLAKKYGWKIGDTIPITGTIYPHPDGEWRFIVRGIYHPRSSDVDANTMYFHWDYLNQTFQEAGIVGIYIIRLASPDLSARVASDIDAAFANSPAETKTETEEAFQASFISMMGNIAFLVNAIGAAVVFAILLVTFNTMMMAARERTGEIAIMKALGYGDGLILVLVIGEALLISLTGGLLGTLGAWGFFTLIKFNAGGMVPSFIVKPTTIVFGILLSITMGILSGIVPAVQASRLRIAQAFREVM
jgi:putative ABC transport system permease protein